jgi:hypothetical protein
MLRSLIADDSFVVEHRHSDGSWGRMEGRPEHHDPAQHDPEQGWQYGHVFVCKSCEEEVRIGSTERESATEGS